MVNGLYNCLDLYVVASRYEGGPQSVVECAAAKVPIVSTSVGLAPEILAPESIYTNIDKGHVAIPNIEMAYNNVKKLFIPQAFESFSYFFSKV